MTNIWTAFANTPFWVYGLFFYLVYVGYRASNTRIIALKKIFIIPLILTSMSVHTLIDAFDIGFLEVGAWSGAITVGAVLGWLEVYRQHIHIRVDKMKHLILVPGSWMSLALILAIFGTKYYFGYELSTDPELADQSSFEYAMLSVSGFCSGLSIGRVICYVRKYMKSAHCSLKRLD